MKRTIIAIIVLTGSFLVLPGCYYDVEEELYGSCSNANVTYSGTINSILSRYSCLSCHSGPTPSGGINLQDYDNVKLKVNDGRLLGAITHSSGYAPMPQGSPKMSQCDISKVNAWIQAGAPQN